MCNLLEVTQPVAPNLLPPLLPTWERAHTGLRGERPRQDDSPRGGWRISDGGSEEAADGGPGVSTSCISEAGTGPLSTRPGDTLPLPLRSEQPYLARPPPGTPSLKATALCLPGPVQGLLALTEGGTALLLAPRHPPSRPAGPGEPASSSGLDWSWRKAPLDGQADSPWGWNEASVPVRPLRRQYLFFHLYRYDPVLRLTDLQTRMSFSNGPLLACPSCPAPAREPSQLLL